MATDAEIRAAGLYAVPKNKYLQNEFQLPTEEVVEETESFGIPQTKAFTNSGDNNFSGYNFDNNSFQNIVNARQNRLNKPTDTSTFMGRTMGTVRDFIEPQSSSQIMTDGYQEPRFQPGIIGMMMGKLDNYRNLPQADQAFIAQNMGYTGPTIFGENNSGLGKDPFGINTRSMFGNYAEYVKKLYEDDEGKVYDPKLQAFKYNRKQFNDKKYEELLNTKKELTQIDKDNALAGKSSPGDKSRTGSLGRRPGSGGTVDRVTEGPGQNVSNVDNQAYDDGGREGFGYGLKDGGRAGYFFGGRARLQGGGMSQGNESNISQSTNMGGGITGDLSTARQTANHDRAMRDNQKEKPSIIKNIIDTGSELSYLNNLKNLNVPGIALNFGVNKFRNFLENRKTKEEDKLSYNTNSLPTNNYTAKLVGPALAQMRTLEKAKGMEQFGGTFSTEQQEGLNKLKQMDQEETIYSQPIFVGANGGRAMFKNGGLASIL